MALTDKLSAIGDAIRTKTGKTYLIPLDQMPTEIASIQSGGGATMKTVEGTLPLTVDGVGQRLEDYKIYGAEGGVGNKTKNLFDISRWSGDQNVNKTTLSDYPGIEFMRYVDGGITITFTADFKENTQYTFTILMRREAGSKAQHTNLQFYYTDGTTQNCIIPKDTLKTFTSTAGKTIQSIKSSSSYSANTYLDLSVTQIEEGTKATAFEPSGYVIPFGANDTVSKVYIGMEKLGPDDYIDYENRKVVIGGVSTMMELPEIHLSNGTNTIDVYTSVKPSKMSVSFVDNGQSNNGASV